MNKKASWIYRSREYRGCGVTAASYKTTSGSWIPEAFFWLQTEFGWRRLWVNSFAHFFRSQQIAFSTMLQADNCAFRMAQTLIDKAAPELETPDYFSHAPAAGRWKKFLSAAHRPLALLGGLRTHRAPN